MCMNIGLSRLCVRPPAGDTLYVWDLESGTGPGGVGGVPPFLTDRTGKNKVAR